MDNQIKDIKIMLNEFISLSDKMRKGYKASLGNPVKTWEQILSEIISPVPDFFKALYGSFAGTSENCEDESLYDFLPAYRLIHINELKKNKLLLDGWIADDEFTESPVETVIPFLTDYDSNYICYVKTQDGTESIFSYASDEGMVEMHRSIKDFLNTIMAFYNEDVYFLDDDGILDYDFEKEGEVAQKYNPDVEFWLD